MYTSKYPIFSVTVDVAALVVDEGVLKVLVVERGQEPYAGRWALPGGFVGIDEDLADAAARELVEETGVEAVRMEQLKTYGAPGRDPRSRVVSVAWLAVLPEPAVATAGTDAAKAAWRSVDELLALGLAFDHDTILRDAVERLRGKLEYTDLGIAFLGEEFTLAQLRHVYEVVWDRELDPGNFQRRIRGQELVEPTGVTPARTGRGRPPELFRAKRD